LKKRNPQAADSEFGLGGVGKIEKESLEVDDVCESGGE